MSDSLSPEAQAVLDGAGREPWEVGAASGFPTSRAIGHPPNAYAVMTRDAFSTVGEQNAYTEAIAWAVNNFARVEQERAALRAERDALQSRLELSPLCELPARAGWIGEAPRPHLRADGVLTRADTLMLSPAELAIRDALLVVEESGASSALTDAVMLLQRARDRVADHVESRPDSAGEKP